MYMYMYIIFIRLRKTHTEGDTKTLDSFDSAAPFDSRVSADLGVNNSPACVGTAMGECGKFSTFRELLDCQNLGVAAL